MAHIYILSVKLWLMTLLFFVLFGFGFLTSAEERVEHADGTSWTFPGKVGGDYFPSGTNSLFAKTDIVKPGGASGGFKEDINLVSSYALFVEQVDAGSVEKLIKRYLKRIDDYPPLRQALREVLKDRVIYLALQQFFEDGGRIEAWEFSGRYDHEKRVISVGLACEEGNICIPALAPESTSIEWKAAFHQPEFQAAFSQFLRAFVFNLQTDPFLSVQKTSKHVMDKALLSLAGK